MINQIAFHGNKVTINSDNNDFTSITITAYLVLFITTITNLYSLYGPVLRCQNEMQQGLTEIQAGLNGRPYRRVGYFRTPKRWFYIIF